MTNEEFSAWRQVKGWSVKRTATELGCSSRTVQAYEKGASRVPRYIALAIAAIQFHLPPYGGD